LLVQLGTPPPEPKAPAPFNHASKPAPLAPPAADTSRFHASAGPDWVFRVLERLIRSGVRLPRTIATKDVWTRINAPGGAIESFPIGWQVLEAYLPANGEDLLLGCGRHLPQGLLVLRVRFDGKLLAAEWRDANSVAPNLHDTPERRTQLEAFVRRLAIERGIPAEMPQFAGAEQDEPGRTPRPSPAEGPARSSSPRLLEPRAEAGRESESDSKSSPCKTRKSNLGGTAPESSGHTDPGLGINKDLEYNRRTQGDNWY
jgi:hypothetical protein